MPRPMDVYEELVHLRRSGQKAALATIVEVQGSIPSAQSAKLLVREDGSMVGTIGGGCTEAEVWNAAREVMENERPQRLRFDLGQDAAYDQGLICGGQLEVYIEPILPIPSAFIFGGGHISKSLSKVATLAGFRTTIIDNREAYANSERFPEAVEIHADEYEDVFPKLAINESCYVVIVTRGHKDDMRILRWAIDQPARYIGMIGSKRKLVEIVKQFQADEGIPPERLQRVHSPMGFDIGAVTPEEIAVSVVGEMIHWRRRPEAGWNAISKAMFAKGVREAANAEGTQPAREDSASPEREVPAETK